MVCRVFRRSRFVVAMVFAMVLFVGVAFAAGQTHTMKNGISFSYPDGWTAMETDHGTMAEQGTVIAVALMNPQDPMLSVAVSVTDGVPENSVPMDEAAWKNHLSTAGQNVEKLTFAKTTVAGKDAVAVGFVVEANGMSIQSYSVSFQDGAKVISVAATCMDASKAGDMKKISEGITGSLKLK